MKKTLKLVLKILVSLGFVAWLLVKVNWPEVLRYAKQLSIWEILIYIGVLLLGMLVSAYKWRVLLKSKGLEFSVRHLLGIYLTGTFINNFMPSFIGGDTYRAYQTGKESRRFKESASAVVMDRITGLLGAMFLALLFALVNWKTISKHQILVSINFAIVAGMVFLVILAQSSNLPIWKKFSAKLPVKVIEFIKSLHEFYLEKGTFLKALAYAMLFSMIGLALVNYVLFLALGIKVGFLDFASVIFLISFISSLPVSVNNIGIKEWAYVTFFGFFGISSSAVVAVALLSRFIQMLVSFFALPLYFKAREK
jgi:uncharacterized protein (TIRG00374 family)